MIHIPFYLHKFTPIQDGEDCMDILDSIRRNTGNEEVCLDLMPCLCEVPTRIVSHVAIFQGERGCRTECYQMAREVILANPSTMFYDLGINFTPCDTGRGYLSLLGMKPDNLVRPTIRDLSQAIKDMMSHEL